MSTLFAFNPPGALVSEGATTIVIVITMTIVIGALVLTLVADPRDSHE